MKLVSLLWICLLANLLSITTALAQQDTCPRIFRDAESLYTDSATTYQWFKDEEPINGADSISFTPLRSGNYAVLVGGRHSLPYEYRIFSHVSGVVFDEYFRPVAQAQVSSGNQQVITNDEGEFSFPDSISSHTELLITVQKEGFWNNQRSVTIYPHRTRTTLMLSNRNNATRIYSLNAARGGTITNGPVIISFPPSSILTQNNRPFNGEFVVSVLAARPDYPNYGWLFPGGDFKGTSTKEERYLETFGFATIVIQTRDGFPLKIDSTVGIRLQFVISPQDMSDKLNEVPVWNFDVESNIWRQNGLARRVGFSLVTVIPTSSQSWTFAFPQLSAQVAGRALDCNGNGVAFAPLMVGQRMFMTDSNGFYAGTVPANIPMTIRWHGGSQNWFAGPFQEQSQNELDTITFGRTIFGCGLIEGNSTLTMNTIGAQGNVQYSINSGSTFQSAPRFNVGNDTQPSGTVKDTTECLAQVPIIFLPKPVERYECVLLSTSELESYPLTQSIADGLRGNSVVHKLFAPNRRQNVERIGYLFPCLQMLWLSENQLDTLPNSLGRLTQLNRLDLSGNRLTKIPDFFAHYTQLKRVGLGANQLKSVPDFVGNMIQLEELNLRDNQLTTLPDSFANLKDTLQEMNLSGNQISTVEQERIRRMLPNTSIRF